MLNIKIDKSIKQEIIIISDLHLGALNSNKPELLMLLNDIIKDK